MDASIRRATAARSREQRASERRPISLAARLTWRDARGATRFASAVTRDVSELGVFVECQSVASIPLFRLVHLQLERDARECSDLPPALRQGRVLSAVYRVKQGTPNLGAPHGYALRLMVDPRRRLAQAQHAPELAQSIA